MISVLAFCLNEQKGGDTAKVIFPGISVFLPFSLMAHSKSSSNWKGNEFYKLLWCTGYVNSLTHVYIVCCLSKQQTKSILRDLIFKSALSPLCCSMVSFHLQRAFNRSLRMKATPNPDSVTSIGAGVFNACYGLKSITTQTVQRSLWMVHLLSAHFRRSRFLGQLSHSV